VPRDDNNRQLSLRDIAAEAGVSVSTVSRVLSGSNIKAKISDKTKKRILSICEQRRFLPNVNYRRLHEGLSRVIAFIIPPPSPQMMFFDENVGQFLSALEPCLAHQGFHIMIQSATPDFLAAKRYIEIFRSHTVDAAILWDVCRDDDHLQAMQQEGKPLLRVAFPGDVLQDQIVPDNFQASYDLTRHLVDLGHTAIAHVAGGHNRIDKDRDLGYKQAMASADLAPLNFYGKYSYESGYSWAEKIMKEHPEVTAIMAANDIAAAGCQRRLKELGLKIPRDISVTGFDGTTQSEIAEPRITTADLRLDKIGRLAADRIVNAVLDPGKYQARITKIQMPLVLRESTGPARKPRTKKEKAHE
jgi:LacI family transcriptional regulator